MAFERSDQKFFLGGRSPSGMTNLLLFLICIGVIVIILLLLFCPRWGCWRGTKVLGPDGRTYDGGNVIINSACCDGGTRTPGCPQCPPCDGETCEEGCRQYSASPEKYKYCMERCNPPQTCEENCRQYSNYPDRYKTCLAECNPPQTCEDRCKQSATSTTEYEACARQCNPPPQTCEDNCRQQYSNYPDRYKICLNECNPQYTCEDRCKSTATSTTTYEACVRECNPTTTSDCRDSDGSNVNTAGEVHLGSQINRDSCYDTTHVIEWVCRDGKPFQSRMTCAEICLNGACVPRPQVKPVCEDSDGNNVNVVGVIRYGDEKHTDTCADSTRVNEWICRDGKPMQTVMTCAGRCLNGACVAGITTPLTYK